MRLVDLLYVYMSGGSVIFYAISVATSCKAISDLWNSLGQEQSKLFIIQTNFFSVVD